jgi:O-antigen ligase
MKKSPLEKVTIYTAVAVSLIFTPMNFDALIIPKIALIFILAMYLAPVVIGSLKLFKSDTRLKILIILSFLIIMQMILSMIISEAPFAQEFYGRTGRGLGLITFLGLTVILLYMAIISKIETSRIIVSALVMSGVFSSSYALLQRFSLDPFNWNSRTNGIIGTLGNPNFQSSFAAMTVIPALVYFGHKKNRVVLIPPVLGLLLLTLYYTQSTQGYIATLSAILVFSSIYFWYKNKLITIITLTFGFLVTVTAIFGMLNRGPLSYWLYKVSVQSRGDFWRSAFEAATSNPLTGIGIDSFGDFYLKYRDPIAFSHPFAEITDNAHNYLLEYAVTGGFPLALLHLGIILLTLISFFSLQKKLNKFNPYLAALFSAWIVFQLQSIISPGTIVLLLWNYLISGFVVGANVKYSFEQGGVNNLLKVNFGPKNLSGFALAICAIFTIFPLFNSDRLLLKALNARDASAVVKSLNSFPQSSVKYNIFGQELLRSNLPIQALEVARMATIFNPNAVSAWGLVFSNPKASVDERINARDHILRLDPLNQEVFKYEIS